MPDAPLDAPDACDLSYEEALLDAEMRAYFRLEYGHSEPPEGVSDRVARAIMRHEEEKFIRTNGGLRVALALATSRTTRLPGEFYRFLSRPDTTRFLSGSMVTALLVMAMAPKIAQTLSPQAISSTQVTHETSIADRTRYFADRNTVDGDFWRDRSGLVEPVPTVPPGQGAVAPGLGDERARRVLEQLTGEDFDAPSPVQMEEDTSLHPIELGLWPKKTKPMYWDRRIYGSQE